MYNCSLSLFFFFLFLTLKNKREERVLAEINLPCFFFIPTDDEAKNLCVLCINDHFFVFDVFCCIFIDCFLLFLICA